MKTTAVLSLVLACATCTWALSDEIKAEAAKFAAVCTAESKVDGAVLKKAMENDLKNSPSEVQCFIKCVFEKANLFKDGGLHVENIREHLKSHEIFTEDKIEHIIENCKDVQGDNECDVAFKALQCYEANKAA